MVMRSLASPIASSAASLRSRETSPVSPPLAAQQEFDHRTLRKIGGPAKGQNTLEGAEQPSELIALSPPWNLERCEAAAHLCIGLQCEQRIRGADNNDAKFQIVGQVLQQIQ
jgi:hypothetical protein